MVRGYSYTEKKTVYGYLFVAEDNRGNTQTQILKPDKLIGLQKMYAIEPTSVERYVNYDTADGKPIYENDMLEGRMQLTNGDTEKVTGWATISKGMACIRTKDGRTPLLFIDDLKIIKGDRQREDDKADTKKWKFYKSNIKKC